MVERPLSGTPCDSVRIECLGAAYPECLRLGVTVTAASVRVGKPASSSTGGARQHRSRHGRATPVLTTM